MNTLRSLISTIAFVVVGLTATAQDYGNIEFIENKGQWDSRVKFQGEVNDGAIFIRSSGFTILQHNKDEYEAMKSFMHEHNTKSLGAMARPDGKLILHSHAFNVDFVGASPRMQVVPDKVAAGYNNYLIGNDPSKWASDCKIYQGITLKEVYPNVDVRYYTYNGTLKYDIIARPGADINKIALKYEGTDKLQVKNKELAIGTSIGELRESYPYSYQSDGKQKKDVSCKYVVKDNIVRFDIKDYDPATTLIIDPNLIFCSLSASPANNWGYTATYGPDGSFFGGGIVFSNGFPTTAGAFQTSYQGGSSSLPFDMGIIKLSANGSNRIYATYIGGTLGDDQPHSLIVDPQGNLIVAGRSSSADYPIVGAPLTGGGGYDIVVTKLNSAGSAPPIGSKKIGGSGPDGVNIKNDRGGTSSLEQNYGDDGRSEVMLDNAGNVYVASCTQSSNFPFTANSFQPNSAGQQDGVVIKFTPTLSAVTFASYLGGAKNDAAYVLSLGAGGDIYVGGGTESDNFIGNHAGTVGPAFHGVAGDIDGFIARISNDGRTIIKSAYIGTPQIDQVYGVKFDRNGFPYVMGQTRGNWPVVNAQYTNPGGKQFIAKLQPDLSAFVYSTMFGNGSIIPNISPTAFLVDRCENVYVSGWGGAINPVNPSEYPSGGTTGLPLTPDALKPVTDNQDFYFFVLKKDAVGTTPLYASYFGQNGGFADHVDGGTSRFDDNGVIYQGVCANCGGGPNFPTTPGAWGTTKPNSAFCNLGMIKMAFNLAGVGADVQSAIGGVPNDTAGCFPLDVTFTDQVRNAVQYIWNFGDGSGDIGPLDAATGYTQPHTFNAVGTYQVMLVAINPASCNVRDTSYINIRVGDLKALLFADYQKQGACNSLSYLFNNNSQTDISKPFTDTSFIWDFGDGSPRVVAGMTSVPHTFPAPGTYNVRLVLNDTSYCNNPDSIPLEVRVAANVDAKFTVDTLGCLPYNAEFHNTSDGGVTWAWDFGDPASGPDNTSTLSSPTHTYNAAGSYVVTFTATDPFTCNITDVATVTIHVFDSPTAAFTYTPLAPIVNTPNIFTNNSSANSVRFKWLFGDGDSLETTSRANVTHQYNATTTFNACLVAYNAAGCPNQTCQDVRVIIEPALDVPNAFTPNSRDVNSIVMVRGFGIAKMRFIIWNRWGKKVFETENRFQGWDGKVNGAVQPMDVYAYTLDVEFFDKTKATKKGDITLIR